LPETTLPTEIGQTFTKLEVLLLERKCKLTSQDPPSSLTAIQGSIWGTTPKTAQKKLVYTLSQTAEGTKIKSTAKLTSSYINLTILGCVMSIVLLIICGWIAIDLQGSGFASNGVTFWSWLVQTNGQLDPYKVEVFVRLSFILTTFLAVSLAIEVYVVEKVRSGIERFAQEIVKRLQF
jgi:hypothetical protein